MLLPVFAGPGFGWSCCDVVDVGGNGGKVVLADGFWLSVKGSSMLSIVQECRRGLLSRHRACGRGRGVKGYHFSSTFTHSHSTTTFINLSKVS